MGKLDGVRRLKAEIRRQSRNDRAIARALFRRAARLHFRDGFTVTELIENGLLNPALGPDDLKLYASRRQYVRLIDRTVPKGYYCLTADQSITLAQCRMAGIPTPNLVAIYDEPQGYAPGGPTIAAREDWIRHFDRTLPAHFFVKPAIGMLGRGAAAFERAGDRILFGPGTDDAGKALTIAEFHDWLAARAAELYRDPGSFDPYLKLTRPTRKILIEERLFAHPDLAAFTGSRNLSCVRAITFVDDKMNVRIISTSMKVIASDSITDNFHKGKSGNFWTQIDRESGHFITAFGPIGPQGDYTRITHHPRSGMAFRDFRIPHWEATLKLAMDAALAFMPHPSVGWDIGITDEGPVIVEGNTRWTILPVSFAEPVPEARQN
ncbi:MAG TPA: sugar-transfer associated ATP-grasp domain-containing protein [Sphingomonadales bacterium]